METNIMIEGASPVGNSLVNKALVWSNRSNVYFSLPTPAEVSIFTVSGMLYDRRSLPAGETKLALPAGFYIIRIPGMLSETKVIVN